MVYRVYRVDPDGELGHLGDDTVQGWEPLLPSIGSQRANRGEILWVGGDRVDRKSARLGNPEYSKQPSAKRLHSQELEFL